MKKILILAIFLTSLTSIAFLVFGLFNQKHNSTKQTTTNQQNQTAKTKTFLLPTVSLESIFEKANDLTKIPKDKKITLLATGDVILARGVNWAVVSKNDFTYPFLQTGDFLKQGDITLINLEAPLISNCPLIRSGFTFCGDNRHIQGLNYAGIDVANLANNHIGNFGSSGITQTKDLLSKSLILWSGFGNLAIKEVKGVKFGFLGYNGVGTPIKRDQIVQEINTAKQKVDIVVVSIHWGEEYVAIPQKAAGIAPDDPVEIGHFLIDSGADLVIGNHPHWVQGVELYKDKLITYAHGNFIFDQTWSEETQEGVVGVYTFYGNKLIDVTFKPIVVDKSYQPKFVNRVRGEKIIKQMFLSSLELKKN